MFEYSKQGAVSLLTGSVALTGENLYLARGALEQALGKSQPRVVLNLQQVPLIDSAGLELLLDWQDQYAARGGAMVLAAPNAICRDVLQATGVASHFSIFDDALAAAGSFSQ